MDGTKDEKLKNLYQMLCDAQDLAESAGELNIMYKIQDLRNEVDNRRFGQL